MTIEKALDEIQFWLDIEGVEGVAQGEFDNEVCITVFVSIPDGKKSLPSIYKGFKVIIEASGEFNAQGL